MAARFLALSWKPGKTTPTAPTEFRTLIPGFLVPTVPRRRDSGRRKQSPRISPFGLGSWCRRGLVHRHQRNIVDPCRALNIALRHVTHETSHADGSVDPSRRGNPM